MSKPRISVGITAFNCHKYLLKAIRSVVNQDSELWEGILILDGGADKKTKKLFDEFEHPKFFKYKFDDNQGPYGTRTKGIELSNTEWYYQLDGDDYLPINSIGKIVKAIQENADAEFIYGNCEYFSKNSFQIRAPIMDPELLCFGPLFNTQSPIKRSLYEKIGGYCKDFYIKADWDFWISVFESGSKGVYLNDSLYCRRHRKNNVGNQFESLKPSIVNKIVERHPQYFSINNRKSRTLFKLYELLARNCRSDGERVKAYENTLIAEKYGTLTYTLEEIKREVKMSYLRYKIRRIIIKFYTIFKLVIF